MYLISARSVMEGFDQKHSVNNWETVLFSPKLSDPNFTDHILNANANFADLILILWTLINVLT